MTMDDPSSAKNHPNADTIRSGPRKSRTIRFSDSEWAQVETTAKDQGIPAAEFVRDAALHATARASGNDSGQISPGIIALIESTYRYAYILATLKRSELMSERRGDEVDEVVRAARESQALLLNRTSE